MAAVLLAEPSTAVAGVLRRFLEGTGHEVLWASSAEEALRTAREQSPVVLLASVTEALDGEALCRSFRKQGPPVAVLLVYPPDEEHAEVRASAAGADGCLVGPLKRGTVVTCVRLLLQREEARARAASAPPPATAPSAPDFDFLKRLLLMEVKRSRRYRYPIALLLVELDDFAARAAALSPTERTTVLAEALGVLVAGVRDIDVAVPAADSRFVVFLPHTPRSGAAVVAGRLRERLKALKGLRGATASVGVAVTEPVGKGAPSGGGQVSFGGLLKEAGEALRRAQAAGGDRVEVVGEGPQPG